MFPFMFNCLIADEALAEQFSIYIFYNTRVIPFSFTLFNKKFLSFFLTHENIF